MNKKTSLKEDNVENKINIAELLKDCPKGMELDCTMLESRLEFDSIVNDSPLPIRCRIKHPDGGYYVYNFTKYGCWLDMPFTKCVIFPKGKTTWEGFHRPFKDGDILSYKHKSNNVKYTFIYKHRIDMHYLLQYCGWFSEKPHLSEQFNVKERMPLCENDDIRFATEEEKAKLLDAIKANGYKWNAETKTLEKLIEPEFKDGDVVISTNNNIHLISCRDKNNGWESCCGMIHGEFDSTKTAHVIPARFAIEEEKQKLFQAIKDNGYRWNAETNTLEELPKFKVGNKVREKGDEAAAFTISDIDDLHYYCGEYVICNICDQDEWELVPDKFDITTLKPFDKVLVRIDNERIWSIQFFERLNKLLKKSFICMGGEGYRQCIPYKGNEHLHNTTNDCDDFYKTWEK